MPARPGYAQVQAAFSALPAGAPASQNFGMVNGVANGTANGGMLQPQMTGSAPQNGSAQASVQQEPRLNPSIWDDIEALAGKVPVVEVPSFTSQPSYLAPQPQQLPQQQPQQQQQHPSFQPSPQPSPFQPSTFSPPLPTSTSSFFPAGQSFIPSSQFGQQFARSDSSAQLTTFSTSFPFQPSGTTPFPTQSFQSSPLYPTPGIGTPTGGSQLTNPFHSSMSMAAMGNSSTPGETNPFFNNSATTSGAAMAQGYFQQPQPPQASQESNLWSFAPQQPPQQQPLQQQQMFAGQYVQQQPQQVGTSTGNPYGGAMGGGTNPFGAGFGQQQQPPQGYGRAWGS